MEQEVEQVGVKKRSLLGSREQRKTKGRNERNYQAHWNSSGGARKPQGTAWKVRRATEARKRRAERRGCPGERAALAAANAAERRKLSAQPTEKLTEELGLHGPKETVL